MARHKTTTKFIIELDYKGKEKEFDQLFKDFSALVSEVRHSKVESKTIDLPPKQKYSDNQKFIYKVLKDICESAKLKRAKKRTHIEPGHYNLFHNTNFGNLAKEKIGLCYCGGMILVSYDENGNVTFKNYEYYDFELAGKFLKHLYFISIEDFFKKYCDRPFNSDEKVFTAYPYRIEPKVLSYQLADPNFQDKIKACLVELGFKYDETFKLNHPADAGYGIPFTNEFQEKQSSVLLQYVSKPKPPVS